MAGYESYERELGGLHESNAAIKSDTKKILEILNGNGSDGLVTKAALNRQSIKRIWWWVGGISTSIFGIAFLIIKNELTR